MTGILIQQELQCGSLVAVDAGLKIPAMAGKSGRAYKRDKKKPVAQAPVNNFIRQWRERADMSQEALSEESGVSVASISAYERGTSDPSMEYLQKLAEALDVPRGMLLDVDPTKDAPLWASVLRATLAPPKGRK